MLTGFFRGRRRRIHLWRNKNEDSSLLVNQVQGPGPRRKVKDGNGEFMNFAAAASTCRHTVYPHRVPTPCHHIMPPHHATTPCTHTVSPHHAATLCTHTMYPRCVPTPCTPKTKPLTVSRWERTECVPERLLLAFGEQHSPQPGCSGA